MTQTMLGGESFSVSWPQVTAVVRKAGPVTQVKKMKVAVRMFLRVTEMVFLRDGGLDTMRWGMVVRRSAIDFLPLMFATIANLGHIAR
jgi:hypothetical protein